MPDVQPLGIPHNRSGTFAGRESGMSRFGWAKIAVAASLLVSGAIVAGPSSGALADAPLPPPVINMLNVPAQYGAAVQQFENNAVSEVLTDHDLPASDASAVTSSFRSGQASSTPDSWPAAPSRCSKLSSIITRAARCSQRTTTSVSGAPGPALTSS